MVGNSLSKTLISGMAYVSQCDTTAVPYRAYETCTLTSYASDYEHAPTWEAPHPSTNRGSKNLSPVRHKRARDKAMRARKARRKAH